MLGYNKRHLCGPLRSPNFPVALPAAAAPGLLAHLIKERKKERKQRTLDSATFATELISVTFNFEFLCISSEEAPWCEKKKEKMIALLCTALLSLTLASSVYSDTNSTASTPVYAAGKCVCLCDVSLWGCACVCVCVFVQGCACACHEASVKWDHTLI